MARDGGLALDAAHRALTLGAADLLGVSDCVGSLVPGKHGDLVILTHDPIDPRAQILAVVQDGRITYRVETKEAVTR
jgi:imidazolonepropionase-like amidohydrolase